MGSKRSLLNNGLGQVIIRQSENATRLVDLMCGAASVASYAAQQLERPVLAMDCQEYATVLARAVIARTEAVDPEPLENSWIDAAVEICQGSEIWRVANRIDLQLHHMEALVIDAREICTLPVTVGPIWNAYGGHYFSPQQSILFDHLIASLPTQEPARSICLACLIIVASKCVASPGHTAQPLQPTLTGARHVFAAWSLDPIRLCREALREICPKYARVAGNAVTGDIDTTVTMVRPDDLVFVDLPYSAVQYSRFYHVLETIARGECGPVTGVGRYPPYNERPQSSFSNVGQSRSATERLLCSLSQAACTSIFTFPSITCSNGLSGEWIATVAHEFFEVEVIRVPVRHSTLGGKPANRQAHRDVEEMIIVMQPR